MSTDDSQNQAASIDKLECRLAELAYRFRSDPDSRGSIVKEYEVVLGELLKCSDWSGEPDLDCQLPAEFMPAEYHRHWQRKAGTAAVIQHEIAKTNGVLWQPSNSVLQTDLMAAIQAVDATFDWLPTNSGDRRSVLCRNLGPLAIVLNEGLKGPAVAELIWRLCQRILGNAEIELDSQGQSEFTEKLSVKGAAGQDVCDTLERYCMDAALPSSERPISSATGCAD